MSLRFEIYSFAGVGGVTLDERTSETEFGNPVLASAERPFGTTWEMAYANPGPHDCMAIIRAASGAHEIIATKAMPEADAPASAIAPNEILRRLVRAGFALYLRAKS